MIVLDAAGTEGLVTDDLRRLIEILSPVTVRLGCLPALISLHRIIDEGGSYQSQLADGWVPYPFLDPAQGYGVVALYALAIAVATVVFAGITWAVSRLRAWT